jgi:UDP-glucose:(heptosyl)LPS alpha-1,3-glucosyltransferase
MNRPRLAVVSPFIDKRHGTERRVAECITRLSDEFEIHIYSWRVEDIPLDRVTWHRIPKIRAPHLFGYLWWFAANRISRWRDARFHGLHFDVIYSPGINCFDADAVSVHVVFAEMRRRLAEEMNLRKSPWRSWPRLIHRRLYYRMIATLERRIYPRESLFVSAVSEQVRGELSRLFGKTGNVEVIYHGVDLDVFSPEIRLCRRAEMRDRFALRDDEFVLLLIGNGWRNKGLHCLIESIAQLRALPIRLLIVGRDDSAPFTIMADKLRISRQLLFLQPSPDVAQFYSACDAYVGPSLHDSFAMPPAEAMACGLPVITSRNNGGCEIIKHGENGLILQDATNAHMLAALIRKLVEDRALCQRLGANAARTARQFTWDENAARMRELFLRAMTARQRQ